MSSPTASTEPVSAVIGHRQRTWTSVGRRVAGAGGQGDVHCEPRHESSSVVVIPPRALPVGLNIHAAGSDANAVRALKKNEAVTRTSGSSPGDGAHQRPGGELRADEAPAGRTYPIRPATA
jgi:hypothetical protein